MADVKFTGLAAGSGIPDNGSIMAISTYDGVSAYTSEKYTMTQLKDIVYIMEAEDKITFDSSGTNKTFVDNGTASIGFSGGTMSLASDSYGVFGEAWLELDPTYSILAFGAAGDWVNVEASNINITKNNVELLTATNTGLSLGGGSLPINIEAESKIVFDSSGTNKQAIKDSVGSQALGFGSDGWIWMSADGTNSLTKGFCYSDDVEFFAGFNNGVGGTFYATETFASISLNGNVTVKQDATGLGFFGATPVAKPTGVAVTAAGIHAALVSLGLIGV